MVHLPAVNTPQFDWCKSVFTRHPQPIAPIYEPEVCAHHILRVALSGRRSAVVGPWTKMLVLLDSLLPAVGDHFAALSAWDGQLADTTVEEGRPVNLFQPADADADFGARGGFDERATGLADPQFLRSVPRTLLTFARAFRLALADRKETAGPLRTPPEVPGIDHRNEKVGGGVR